MLEVFGRAASETPKWAVRPPRRPSTVALYRDRDRRFAWGNHAHLLAVTHAVASTPAPPQRAVVLALSAGGAWLDTAVWRPTPGMGWFAPAYFLKPPASHAAGATPTRD